MINVTQIREVMEKKTSPEQAKEFDRIDALVKEAAGQGRRFVDVPFPTATDRRTIHDLASRLNGYGYEAAITERLSLFLSW
ncbi:MAG TPA: hypothetical protein VFC78_21210 [Tepidisphaeraceae bacterium]|nr:hypothetical protein [Tepidisphaeraceae bacterium]